jgi:hypothetical protein
MEEVEILTGGSMSQVLRVGNTVRRQAGPWSGQVQHLLAHLRASGIEEVPAPLGFDEQGREMLAYIPGTVGHFPLPGLHSDQLLSSAARLLARIHAASAEIAQRCPTGWQAPTREPVEVICHGDFAPYNCVFRAGQLVGLIDFDHAHAGSRQWDLAYALYRFAALMHPSNPECDSSLADQCLRVRLFCDEYGLQDRSNLVATIQARIAYMADHLLQGAAQGDGRCQANIAAGHLAIYTTDLAYVRASASQLQQALG